jgi:hypothetical protein
MLHMEIWAAFPSLSAKEPLFLCGEMVYRRMAQLGDSWKVKHPQPFNFPKLISPPLSFLLLHLRRSLMLLFFKYMIKKIKYFSLKLYISYAFLMI